MEIFEIVNFTKRVKILFRLMSEKQFKLQNTFYFILLFVI